MLAKSCARKRKFAMTRMSEMSDNTLQECALFASDATRSYAPIIIYDRITPAVITRHESRYSISSGETEKKEHFSVYRG
jgi:hypothetical protein